LQRGLITGILIIVPVELETLLARVWIEGVKIGSYLEKVDTRGLHTSHPFTNGVLDVLSGDIRRCSKYAPFRSTHHSSRGA
jgi:hypothetical protein